MESHYIALLLAVVLTVAAQTILKFSTQTRHERLFFLLGNSVLIIVIVCSLYALKKIPLREMALVQPIIQLSIVLTGICLFKEKLVLRQWIALLLVIAGILVFKADLFLPS